MKPYITFSARHNYSDDPDAPITSFEAAAFLGISTKYLYRLVHNKQIPCYKPTGKRLFFFRNELIIWIKQNKSAKEYCS
jgi:excisionase family DNA binding protein